MTNCDALITLQPNRDLIDSTFDRYILMNEKLTMRRMDLKRKAHFQTPSNEQFSFQHVKTFISVQRLVNDDMSSDANVDICYTILESGAILCARFDKNNLTWLSSAEVATVKCVVSPRDDNVYPPTLLLVNKHFAIASDGCGAITVFHTGDRREAKQWTPLNLESADKVIPHSILVDVRCANGDADAKCLNVLLQTVVCVKNQELGKTVFTTHFVWITAEKSGEEYKVVRHREISCDGQAEFATLDAASSAVFVVSNERPTLSLEATNDTSPVFNSEQLEECDQLGDIVYGYWIDGDSQQIICNVDFVGSPFLFPTRPIVGASLCFATRSDVDGVMWRLDSSPADGKKIATHMFTLQAFGFIQAGHNEKQFIGCSTDGRYAIIVNRKNHVFIYFQNASIDKQCELKNRKTGVVKNTVAKQVVFTLSQADTDYNINEPDSEYIGFHAASEFLYLLTHNALIVVKVKEDQN